MASLPRNSLLALLAAALISGCADYMNNRDTITLGAGDAMEANLGIQTIDPFPIQAKNTHIRVDGAKTRQAYERYLKPCDQQQVTNCGSSSGGGPAIAITNNMPDSAPAK